MEYFIHWAGFVGAWLLVAGPLVQAALELRDENLDRDSLTSMQADIPERPKISKWWWLLPPVAYIKNYRRQKAQRDAYMRAMTREQREQMVGFGNKASGWFFVAGGAFLIFMKEAWELNHLYEVPTFVYWIVVVVLAIAAIASTIIRLSVSDKMIHADDPEYTANKRAERSAAQTARRTGVS
ncbi:hypothetical protein BH11ACT3_BH11ACT3_23860 [soil metagenome]